MLKVLCVFFLAFVSTLNPANSKFVDSNKCNRPFTDVYLTLMHMSASMFVCVQSEKKRIYKHLLVSTKANENPLIISMQISKEATVFSFLNGFSVFVFDTFGKWLFHVRFSLNRSQSTISLQIVFSSSLFTPFATFFPFSSETLFVSLALVFTA